MHELFEHMRMSSLDTNIRRQNTILILNKAKVGDNLKQAKYKIWSPLNLEDKQKHSKLTKLEEKQYHASPTKRVEADNQ